MRLPRSAHDEQGWRIAEIAPDFEVEDVWALDNQGQMAVLVKPRGRFGKVYMDLIKPFRHLIVYPALMRQIEKAWDSRDR